MRHLIHISDLHFGRIDKKAVEALTNSIIESRPHLLIVSGDLTQRARRSQFIEAKNFLQRTNCDKIVVAGNHDVPLFNVFDRFMRPYHHFKSQISMDLNPSFEDEELLVQGVTTAHAWTIAGGRLSPKKIDMIRSRWKNKRKVKILVSHHPFEIFTTAQPVKKPGYRSHLPSEFLTKTCPDILLSGHLHYGDAAISSEIYKSEHRSFIVAQAGTASSTRTRKENNSFNEIMIGQNKIRIKKMLYSDESGGFSMLFEEQFILTETGWKKSSY